MILDRLQKTYSAFLEIAKNANLTDSPKQENTLLQAVPRALSKPTVSVADARKSNRIRFGRSISMDKIEMAVRQANNGSMQQITDLSRETIDTDPHLCSVLFKRFGASTTLPWEIHTATGPGVDKERARFYASIVREAVGNIPHFRQRMLQLAWGVYDGRSVHEIVWKAAGSSMRSKFGNVTIVPQTLDWIHPRRINFGPERQLVITDESASVSGNFSPVGFPLDEETLRRLRMTSKFIKWTPSLFGEYQEREGLGPRSLYWSFFKRFSQRERMILIELFGKPWRIIEVPEDADVSETDLDDAEAAADSLGGATTARMPRGTKLNVVKVDANSSKNHQIVIEDCDRQLSKLVLGQTGTTDPNPAGLNNTQASVMLSEQAVVMMWDAKAISEIITSQLCDRIIVENFGENELVHAPSFVLRYDRPSDRQTDIDRLKKTLDAGVEVALVDAYESTGFRQPENDEPVIRIDQPPIVPGSANPPLPRPVAVYPSGQSPESGEQLPPAEVGDTGEGSKEDAAGVISVADLSKIVTVNEARAAQNLPPLAMPDGTPDPDGFLTLIEFQAVKTSSVAAIIPAMSSGGDDDAQDDDNDDEDDEGGGDGGDDDDSGDTGIEPEEEDDEESEGEQADAIAAEKSRIAIYQNIPERDALTKVLGESAADIAIMNSIAAQDELDRWFLLANESHGIGIDDHKQPSSENGDPEEIMANGMRELTREPKKWADKLESAVVGLATATAINSALLRAGADLSPTKYGRVLERRMTQTSALGILDSETDFSGKTVENFSNMPFQRAMRIFRNLNAVTKPEWNLLEAEIKRKSFTVAGLQTKTMVQTAQHELTRQIAKGADLRQFRRFMKDRFESAGLIPRYDTMTRKARAAHVETVFRTNTLNAYGAGRQTHMSQPRVISLRPVWEISGINDRRTRPNHLKAHGQFLYATDRFWQRAYPPFGFNCRCRITSHPLSRDLTSRVVSGSSIPFLPDDGFFSGLGMLLI
jgi:SPP1 gp7 family putative phage head morphogenesis protein